MIERLERAELVLRTMVSCRNVSRYMIAATGCTTAITLITIQGISLLTRFRRRKSVCKRFRAEVEGALLEIAKLPEWDVDRACIILSGGLDTSIAAEAGQKILGLGAAFTVVIGDHATDRPYAKAVASKLGLKHCVLDLSLEELLSELHWTISILKTFDPMSLRNNIAIAHALKAASKMGYTCAVTGDGADEILGGYNFTHRLSPTQWQAHRGKAEICLSAHARSDPA